MSSVLPWMISPADQTNANIMKSLDRIVLSSLLFLSPALLHGAEEKHHHEEHGHEMESHDAHVHGEVLLNIVIEGNSLAAEMISPAMNIVGFEHAPATREQKTAVTVAIGQLEKTGTIFVLPEAAGCSGKSANVESSLADQLHEEHHGEDDHGKHEDGHAEFHVTQELQCTNASALGSLEVKLFETYPGVESVKVQWIKNSRQGAAIVSADGAVITLK